MSRRAAKAVAGPLFSFITVFFLLSFSDPAAAFSTVAREGSPLNT